MLAMDAISIKDYFLMKDDNTNHPAEFVQNHVTGIFFQNTVRYDTWFGNNTEYIHGIQMLPLSPALELTRDQDFCEQEWRDVLGDVPNDETYPWTSLLVTGNQAVWGRDSAYALLEARRRGSWDDGLTKSFALYWTAAQTPISLLVPIATAQPDRRVFPPSGLEPRREYPPGFTEVPTHMPKHTNKFWLNWAVENPGEHSEENYAIFVMPYTLKWHAKGNSKAASLGISHSSPKQLTNDQNTGRIQQYTTPYVRDMSLGCAEELDTNHVITKEFLFGVHIDVRGPPPVTRRITYPIFQGMAYVSALYSGDITPEVVADAPLLSVTKVSDGIWMFVNEHSVQYRVYAFTERGDWADSTHDFDRNGVMNKKFNGWLRTVHILRVTDIVDLDLHARSVVVDWKLEVEMGGIVRYRFETQAGAPDPDGPDGPLGPGSMLHFAYPHHAPLLRSNQISRISQYEAPTKGKMTGIIGTVWEMNVDTSKVEALTWLPVGTMPDDRSAMVAEEAKADLEFFEQDNRWRTELFKPSTAADPTQHQSYYWAGKGFQKLGTVCLLLEELVGSQTDHLTRCVDLLERAFKCMWAPGEGDAEDCVDAPPGSLYDDFWGGIPSRRGFYASETKCYDLDFGNACYNDHHYHFGYFVVSGAILAKLRPSYRTNHRFIEWVNTLIRDTNNPSSLDEWFPTFRYFDWFDFHSWSRGVMPDINGKDQESTSEELNLLYGMVLWGRVLNRPRVSGLGATMLACDAISINAYFLMKDGNPNHPVGFVKNHVTGIFFQNTVRYDTWFGTDPKFIHGIQMLPLSPALQLTRDAEFCEQEWAEVLTLVNEDVTDPWTSLLVTGNLAVWARDWAFELLEARTRESLDDGLTKSFSLYWTAMQTDGQDKPVPPTPTPAPPGPPQGGNFPWYGWLGIVLLVFGILAGGAAVYVRRQGGERDIELGSPWVRRPTWARRSQAGEDVLDLREDKDKEKKDDKAEELLQ
jgi:endo-1,3(4)-beta-glucanase